MAASTPHSTPTRRLFLQGGLALAGLSLLSGCAGQVAPARPSRSVPLIALLAGLAPPTERVEAVRGGMQELGYVDGQTVTYEYRYANGEEERLPGLAAELVALKPDVIVTINSAAIRPAKEATTSIPIVMVADNADPVVVGYVASLAHPGGNLTGVTGLSPAVTRKRLEILAEAVPGLSRVGMLRNPNSQDRDVLWSETEAAARALGLGLRALDVRSVEDISAAFELAVREGLGGLAVIRDPLVTTNRKMIAELAARFRVPAMYASREFVEAGGLMSYGSNIYEMYRRTATYVDKILRGAKPADLPIEQAEHFELVVNATAMRALGLSMPESIMLRATEVIQ